MDGPSATQTAWDQCAGLSHVKRVECAEQSLGEGDAQQTCVIICCEGFPHKLASL